jgi:hypothetical protein
MNGTTTSRSDARSTGQWALRVVGALALLVMAGVHLQRLLGAGYDQIPTIGTLFWLNVASGVILAGAILLWGGALAAAAGAAVAGGSIVGLIVSHAHGLFGWIEPRYDAAAIIALASEGVAVAALALLLAEHLRAGHRPARTPAAPRGLVPR